MHLVKRAADVTQGPHPVFIDHSEGYTVAALIDHTSGSVHTGTSLNELAPGGFIAPHLHSFEEGFYILEGLVVVGFENQAYLLGPGDFGVAKVGALHSWRNASDTPVRWLQMCAPQPKPVDDVRDTFFKKDAQAATDAEPLGVAALRGDLLGHFDVGQIPPLEMRAEVIAGAQGVFLKWMIDEHFGARHQRMLFIEYQPGAGIPLHDHTFEESYYILSGEIEATMDGEVYRGRPGDVFWTSVGCVHAFRNARVEPVRWIETFSPQPPAENVFRFSADWEKRAAELENEAYST